MDQDKPTEEIPAGLVTKQVKVVLEKVETDAEKVETDVEKVDTDAEKVDTDVEKVDTDVEKLKIAEEKVDHSVSVEGIVLISAVLGGEPVLDPNAPNFKDDPPFAVGGGTIVDTFGTASAKKKDIGNGTSHDACVCEQCACCDNCKHGNSPSTRGCQCISRDANVPTKCCGCAACKCLVEA